MSCSGAVCFFQAEDGIRDLVRSRGLGDVYKRQVEDREHLFPVRVQTLQVIVKIRLEAVRVEPLLELSLIHI